jgi:hypothetical protein
MNPILSKDKLQELPVLNAAIKLRFTDLTAEAEREIKLNWQEYTKAYIAAQRNAPPYESTEDSKQLQAYTKQLAAIRKTAADKVKQAGSELSLAYKSIIEPLMAELDNINISTLLTPANPYLNAMALELAEVKQKQASKALGTIEAIINAPS